MAGHAFWLALQGGMVGVSVNSRLDADDQPLCRQSVGRANSDRLGLQVLSCLLCMVCTAQG
jgi:hypothetical protein